ncbi:hypothetical protein [Saccharothrix xinjiangensis]|uniref:Ribosomally synthesized peptide with SipW-like signal peptide n=1 Tax=Saccharothrix xinjiangensis TaxID=204798 RepID=A0ABV9XUQ8_9PSEU
MIRRVRWLALVLVGCVAAAYTAYAWVPLPGTRGAAIDTGDERGPLELIADYGPPLGDGEASWQAFPSRDGLPDIPADSDCAGVAERGRSRGAVDSGWSDVTLTVRARRTVTFTVVAVRPEVLSTRPPAEGHTLLCVDSPQPHMTDEYHLQYSLTNAFVLDQGNPYDVYDVIGEQGSDTPLQLGFGELQHFRFRAFALACDCTWLAEVELRVEGERQVVTLGSDSLGEPFRTVPRPEAPGDSTANSIWCAVEGAGRLTTPAARDCPVPRLYEGPIY